MNDYEGEGAPCSQRRLVNRFLRAFMVELRIILKRCAPEYYRAFPNARRPCHSCAFNPATDHQRGWDTTAMHLEKAIREGTPFSCHQGIPWRAPIQKWSPRQIRHFLRNHQLCAGYVAIVLDPETKTAVERAAAAAMERA